MLLERVHKGSITVALFAAVATLGGCAGWPASSPPPSVPVAPNGSLVTARVVAIQTAANQAVERLSLDVLTAEPLKPGLLNAVTAGQAVWAQVPDGASLDPSILGRTVRATVRRVGDEWGQHLQVSDVAILNPPGGAGR